MGRAKQIIIKIIPSNIARPFVKKYHYSGKVNNTSSVHFGAFLDGKLHGVISMGSPMDKKKVINLVKNTAWNGMLEINRIAFDEYLPRNSESRALSICVKLLRKNAPHVKWLLSYADATQCGDGSIYRAAGFYLTGIKKSTQIIKTPDGQIITRKTLTNVGYKKRAEIMQRLNIPENGKASIKQFIAAGCVNLVGFQNRYILLIDKTAELNVPILAYSEIDKNNAGMYRGKKITVQERKLK